MTLVTLNPITLRQENSRPVAGLLAVAQKPTQESHQDRPS